MITEEKQAFEHYRDSPLVLDRSRAYEQRVHFKPRGLWLSVPGEDDWPSFCRDEEFDIERLAVKHAAELAEGQGVLNLSSVSDIRDFHADYKESMYPGGSQNYIDWNRVAELHDGIIIAPYQWSIRYDMEMSWYYSWDVASGCIWNLDAIERIEAI